MKEFMDKDFILENDTAKYLYHNVAAAMPLIDYHCHISPKEIYENRRFENLAQVWLGGQNPDGSFFGDHYKWRLMRSNGVSEDYITGDKPDFERFYKLVETLELSIGNPMYHWCHLELRQFFGCHLPLTTENAKEIWDLCNEKLQNDPSLTVRGIIAKANVAMIGTTDDPIDSLEWHEKIRADASISVAVCPSFRPDKAINITKEGFLTYIDALAQSVRKDTLQSAQEVCDALLSRLTFFKALGCRASDHGLDYIPYQECTMDDADRAFQKAKRGEALSLYEAECYQTQILLFLGRAYHEMDIAMQLHYSCLRNVNEKMFKKMGPDTGFDVIGQNTCGGAIANLLSALDRDDKCPKTILYSLNPADNAQLGTILGAFQSSQVPGKIQHGSAWWFNDTKDGMIDQMKSLANLGILGNFVGMLTDSRSFLSYARHDYFRRILCNLIGQWVENGEYPNHPIALQRIVEGICYRNAARYFEV